jgi:hypothetical protein
MSNGMRILVLLTDGHDLGSKSSLSGAIAAARRANVVVYAIAAGSKAEKAPLQALASATGGKVFDAADAGSLGSTYQALSRELDRTWQISYLTTARPGDRLVLSVRAAGRRAAVPLHVPGSKYGPTKAGSVARAAEDGPGRRLLVARCCCRRAGVGGEPPPAQVRDRPAASTSTSRAASGRPRIATARAASSHCSPGRSAPLEELPGSEWLARAVERSGLNLRVGHLPYLAGLSALVFGVLVTVIGAPPVVAVLCMLIGLGVPLLVLPAGRCTAPEGVRPAAAGRALDDRLDAARRPRPRARRSGRSPTTAVPRVGGVQPRAR